MKSPEKSRKKSSKKRKEKKRDKICTRSFALLQERVAIVLLRVGQTVDAALKLAAAALLLGLTKLGELGGVLLLRSRGAEHAQRLTTPGHDLCSVLLSPFSAVEEGQFPSLLPLAVHHTDATRTAAAAAAAAVLVVAVVRIGMGLLDGWMFDGPGVVAQMLAVVASKRAVADRASRRKVELKVVVVDVAVGVRVPPVLHVVTPAATAPWPVRAPTDRIDGNDAQLERID